MSGTPETSESMYRVRLRVRGKVQGVFYRASTLTEAQRLGLQGHVQNMPDGSVEVLARGSKGQVEQLVAWCRQGPPLARVSTVDEEEPIRECDQELSPFRIKRESLHGSDRPVHGLVGRSVLSDGDLEEDSIDDFQIEDEENII